MGLNQGLNKDVSNADYHGDRVYLSSSALKLLHKSPRDFHKKYILNEPEEITNQAALTFGTVAHLKILEPHLMESEVAVYPGPARRGAEYKKFEVDNEGKNIITIAEADKLDLLYKAYMEDGCAVDFMKGVQVEATYCGEWGGLPVKVRCDAINAEKGYILDVKTTSYENDLEAIRDVVGQLYYDLSAALYVDVCSAFYGRAFDFYLLVLSKRDNTCKMYKVSDDTLEQGRIRLKEAVDIYNRCMHTNIWEHDVSLAAKARYKIEEV